MGVYMQQKEINLIISLLKEDDVMLEWGSGGSTLFFPQFVDKYYSIEHDKEWFLRIVNEMESILEKLKPNKIYFVPPEVKEYNNPAKKEEFESYIKKVNNLPEKKIDKVLIDGRARFWCGLEVLPYLKDDSLVFVHDFMNRERYHGLLEKYNLIGHMITLGVLKPK